MEIVQSHEERDRILGGDPYGITPGRPDRDSAPFWMGLREKRVAIQQCSNCGAHRFPARCICNRCGSWGTRWNDSPGTGTVFSWAVVHHPLTMEYVPAVPYTILAVRLDEQDDLVVPGGLAGPLEPWMRIGLRARAEFLQVADGSTLLMWNVEPPEGLVSPGDEALGGSSGGGAA